MKKIYFHRYLLFFSLSFCAMGAKAQQKLVLNGAFINIANGATLVISNPASTAIVRNSGHIITEGQNNTLKWNTGTSAGTYTVPLGYNGNYIPLIFTKTAGTGNGYFAFSTYHTGWNNSALLPSGVLNVNYNGVDNSAYTIDRFWKIDAAGYTTKPVLSDLTFTYIDAEYTASGNSITESELGAQRWNSTINDWGDFIPGVSIDVTTNKLILTSVSAANLFKWWTLPALNGNHALPVELVDFKGSCNDGSSEIEWSTASELNNDHFTLESSPDGVNWTAVKNITGAGNSNRLIHYSASYVSAFTETYYRLQQTDYNGHSNYSAIIKINCDTPRPVAVSEVYPNPSDGAFHLRNAPEGGILNVIDNKGEIVYSEEMTNTATDLNLQNLSNGVYTLSIRKGQDFTTHKLIIQK